MVRKVGLAVMALVLVLLVGTGCGVNQKSPEATAKAFAQAVKKKNFKTMEKLLIISPMVALFAGTGDTLMSKICAEMEADLKKGSIKSGTAKIREVERYEGAELVKTKVAEVPLLIGGKPSMKAELEFVRGKWFVVNMTEAN